MDKIKIFFSIAFILVIVGIILDEQVKPALSVNIVDIQGNFVVAIGCIFLMIIYLFKKSNTSIGLLKIFVFFFLFNKFLEPVFGLLDMPFVNEFPYWLAVITSLFISYFYYKSKKNIKGLVYFIIAILLNPFLPISFYIFDFFNIIS
jgi:hypothetical protein